MTEKLYYKDSFLTEFTGTVLSCQEDKGSWAVTLDRTAFYPEGGGQPADQGLLGGAAVTDVRERDGEIVHICAGPLPVGESVSGQVDFARRFDFMQQHSPTCPLDRRWVPQQAQQSAPGQETIRTCPVRAFLLRYASFSSSAGEGKETSTTRSSQMYWLARRSTSSTSSGVSWVSKSMVTSSWPMWKPTLEQWNRPHRMPLTMCSPLCCCMKSNRRAKSTCPDTLWKYDLGLLGGVV